MPTSNFIWGTAIFAILATFITASLAVPVRINMMALASELTNPLLIRDAFQPRDCKPVCVKTPNPRECVTDCVNDLYGFLDYCRGFRIECDSIDLNTEEGRKKCSCECKQLMGEQIECPKAASSRWEQPRQTATKTISTHWTETATWTETASSTATVKSAKVAALINGLPGRAPRYSSTISLPAMADAAPKAVASIYRHQKSDSICHASGKVGVSLGFSPRPIALPPTETSMAERDLWPEATNFDPNRRVQCQYHMLRCQKDQEFDKCATDCSQVKFSAERAAGSPIPNHRNVPGVLPDKKPSKTTKPVSQPSGTSASTSPGAGSAGSCEEACVRDDDFDQSMRNCKKDLDAFREAQCQDYIRSCQEDKNSKQCKKDCSATINRQSAGGSHIEIDHAVPNGLRSVKMSEEDLCMIPGSDLYKSSKNVNKLTVLHVPIATSKPNSADVKSCAVACNKGAKKWYLQPGGDDDCNLAHGDFDELPCAQNKCQNDCMMNALKWWRKICHLEYPELTEKECNARIGFIYPRGIPDIDEDTFKGF